MKSFTLGSSIKNRKEMFNSGNINMNDVGKRDYQQYHRYGNLKYQERARKLN
jgi:hypothetical protein